MGGRPVTSEASPGRVGVAEGTRPRISRPWISSRTRLDIRGRVPSQQTHPTGTRSARDRSPTHVSIRTLNQVPHPQILVHCYKINLKFSKKNIYKKYCNLKIMFVQKKIKRRNDRLYLNNYVNEV